MNDRTEYLITPEAVFEPETQVFYAQGLEKAQELAAQKGEETGQHWRIYQRVQ